mmetsp:Transcript_42080/g.107623  ORF Transcript_42080/g.107623 Transcript_42080/m.107623 type:complete len:227 (+) Transcript_42080:2390-3070(+)
MLGLACKGLRGGLRVRGLLVASAHGGRLQAADHDSGGVEGGQQDDAQGGAIQDLVHDGRQWLALAHRGQHVHRVQSLTILTGRQSADGGRQGVGVLGVHPDATLLRHLGRTAELLKVGALLLTATHRGPAGLHHRHCQIFGGGALPDEDAAKLAAHVLQDVVHPEDAWLPDGLLSQKLARLPGKGLILGGAIATAKTGRLQAGQRNALLRRRAALDVAHHHQRVTA